MNRVGQNYMYTAYIWYLWQGITKCCTVTYGVYVRSWPTQVVNYGNN
jgi:hypothetical protein